jgi:hypothetical protein
MENDRYKEKDKGIALGREICNFGVWGGCGRDTNLSYSSVTNIAQYEKFSSDHY